MLLQTVTTVWRTELGTTLLNGFNSTTVESAYFRLPVLYQSATNRDAPRERDQFLSRMAPRIGHFASDRLPGRKSKTAPLFNSWWF
jgi:hypothetical protein